MVGQAFLPAVAALWLVAFSPIRPERMRGISQLQLRLPAAERGICNCEMLESPASRFALRYGAPLSMTAVQSGEGKTGTRPKLRLRITTRS
jgi:hypothetical protein